MVDLARKILLHDKIRFLITVSGVAFAVTLVFVQVGLFEGLLANASITIERVDADLWVSARNTPNVDFANTFPETFVQRVRSVPGVARADNLIVWFVPRRPAHRRQGERRRLRPGGLRPLEPPLAGRARAIPATCGGASTCSSTTRRRSGSARSRWATTASSYGQRLKIIGRTREARSFTTNPIAFLDYRVAQSLDRQELHNRTTYILVKLAPGADPEAVRAEIRRRLPYNDVRTRERVGGPVARRTGPTTPGWD